MYFVPVSILLLFCSYLAIGKFVVTFFLLCFVCQQETKERFDLSEKWEKEKRNLTDEHRKNMNKLQQDMETEKNKLQKDLDQMVCVTLIFNLTFSSETTVEASVAECLGHWA